MKSQPDINMLRSQSFPTEVKCECGEVLFALDEGEGIYPHPMSGNRRMREGRCAKCMTRYRVLITQI